MSKIINSIVPTRAVLTWYDDRYGTGSKTFLTGSDGYLKTSSDVNVPNWRELIKGVEDATSDYSVVQIGYDRPDGYFLTQLNNLYHTSESGSGKLITPAELVGAGTILANAQRDCSSRFYERLRGATVESGVIAGELLETLRMIRHPFTGLTKGMGTYLERVNRRVKVRRRSKAKLLEDISSIYLESVFGWMPFIADINDAFSAYDEVVAKPLLDYRVITASGFDSLSSTVAGANVAFSGYNTTAQTRVSHLAECKAYAKAWVLHELSVPGSIGFERERRSWGLTLEAFIPTLYELIPYSFLLDYVTNVGSVLSARVTNTNRVKFGYTSHKLTRISHRFPTKVYYNSSTVPVKSISANYGFASKKETTYSRTRGIPEFPDVTFELPNFKQAVNVAALILGRSRAISRYISKTFNQKD